jgi:hypothetical protein
VAVFSFPDSFLFQVMGMLYQQHLAIIQVAEKEGIIIVKVAAERVFLKHPISASQGLKYLSKDYEDCCSNNGKD